MKVSDAITALRRLDPNAEFGFYRFSGQFASSLKFQPIIDIGPSNDDAQARVGIMLGSPQEVIEKR